MQIHRILIATFPYATCPPPSRPNKSSRCSFTQDAFIVFIAFISKKTPKKSNSNHC